MTLKTYKVPLTTLLSAVALFAFAHTASAMSTVVNSQVSGALTPGYMESTYNTWESALGSPNVQVRYSAEAVNTNTGADVCGTSVPLGTHINLRLVPRDNSDITWNGTGGNWDTPYGYWQDDAAFPGVYCAANDYIANFTSQAWGSINFYTPLSVNPPSRSISLANSNLSCDSRSDGTKTCTAVALGDAGVSFDIASTYGRYYFHTKASYNTSSTCAGKLASGWFGLGLISPIEPMRLFAYSSWNRGNVGYGVSGSPIPLL